MSENSAERVQNLKQIAERENALGFIESNDFSPFSIKPKTEEDAVEESKSDD